MQLYYNAAKKYKKPIPADTGTRQKYDIKELRLRPVKLTKAPHEQELEGKMTQKTRHDMGGMGAIPEES